MSTVYKIPVTIAATAYVQADARDSALAALRAKGATVWLELNEDANQEIPISGANFDSDELPEISLSPAMTLYFTDMGKSLTVDDVEIAGE